MRIYPMKLEYEWKLEITHKKNISILYIKLYFGLTLVLHKYEP